jgi:predicted Fe-S protein YdhL (DUF1289 family)
VDKFHFIKNHKGLWCDKMVNPLRVPAMKGINSVICEQRFRHINRFGPMLRRMRRERFAWTMLSIVEQDHIFRKQGVLAARKKAANQQ